jgi:hypothetical protein
VPVLLLIWVYWRLPSILNSRIIFVVFYSFLLELSQEGGLWILGFLRGNHLLLSHARVCRRIIFHFVQGSVRAFDAESVFVRLFLTLIETDKSRRCALRLNVVVCYESIFHSEAELSDCDWVRCCSYLCEVTLHLSQVLASARRRCCLLRHVLSHEHLAV